MIELASPKIKQNSDSNGYAAEWDLTCFFFYGGKNDELKSLMDAASCGECNPLMLAPPPPLPAQPTALIIIVTVLESHTMCASWGVGLGVGL
jgi:hypothetical protein